MNDTVTDGPAAPSRSQRLAHVLAVPLAILLAGILAVFYALDTSIVIDGESMLPELRNADRVLVTRGYDRFVRGDVVVLRPPAGSRLAGETRLVKRIIAVGGDEIEVHMGRALVNGEIEHGSYTVLVANRDIDVALRTVPEGMIYVLGDNRPISEDSRVFGPVPVENVIGRVVGIYAPIQRVGRVD